MWKGTKERPSTRISVLSSGQWMAGPNTVMPSRSPHLLRCFGRGDAWLSGRPAGLPTGLTAAPPGPPSASLSLLRAPPPATASGPVFTWPESRVRNFTLI